MLIVQRLDGRVHNRGGLDCGEPSLNQYLRALATQHYRAGVASAHILVDDVHSRVLGYLSLAAAQMSLNELSEADRGRLPHYPVPVARLARLAVALNEQRHRLGEALLQGAVKRCLDLRSELGVHALLVDALHERGSVLPPLRVPGNRGQSLDVVLPLGEAGKRTL